MVSNSKRGNRVLPLGTGSSEPGAPAFANRKGSSRRDDIIAGLKAANIAWVSMLSRLLLLVLIAPALACGLFIALPSDPIDEPGVSSGNLWFTFGHCSIMLFGSLCVSLGITYAYGHESQRWPLFSAPIYLFYMFMVELCLCIVPMLLGVFPIRFFVPPAAAMFWMCINAALAAQYVSARRKELLSSQAYQVARPAGKSEDDANAEQALFCPLGEKKPGSVSKSASSCSSSSSSTSTSSSATKTAKTEHDVESYGGEEPLPSTRRMWMTVMGVLLIFGAYYFLCCFFFIIFANVSDSAGAKLSSGVLFVVFNWFARSYLLRIVLQRGGSAVNWASLHIMAFWFEVMGEVFVGLAISRTDAMYFFGTMLGVESTLFAVSTAMSTRRALRHADAGNARRCASSLEGIFLHVVAELAATLTFTMTLATVAFSSSSHMFPFTNLTLAEFERTVGVVFISFAIHVVIFFLAQTFIALQMGVNCIAVGSRVFNRRINLILLFAQGFSIPTLIFSLLTRQYHVGYDLLLEDK